MTLAVTASVQTREVMVQRESIAGVRLGMRFDIYDTADPGTVLHRQEEQWDYDLPYLVGLSPAQLLQMIRDTGQEVPPVEVDGHVIQFEPDPPPMRQRGQELLAEYMEGSAAIGANLAGQEL